MCGALKQIMASRLITKNDIREFVIGLYGIADPVLCVWTTIEPPTTKLTDDTEVYDLNDAIIFIKEDVESIFLPRDFIANDWNLVLLCLKYKHEPILGWLMGATPDNFLSFADDLAQNLDSKF